MLKYFKRLFYWSLLFIYGVGIAQSAQSGLVITENVVVNSFPIFSNSATPVFYCDDNDAKVVQLSYVAFLKDVQLVSGKQLGMSTAKVITDEFAVVTGTIGHSKLIDELIQKKILNVNAIKNKWEQFSITVIPNSFNKKAKSSNNSPEQGPDLLSGGDGGRLLVIAGSDNRGTAFGIFHLSRLMGVSPFVWWADVMPQKKQQLFVSGNYTSPPPSVKYRGIFINDEDWGLQPWAAKTFEPETGDIGPKTYAKVFELMLRLRANLIWPAMHDCTKAFFKIPGNAKVAEDYSIMIGSSHAEPMLRNNVGEWDEKTMGHFNYITNKETVYKYWEDRVKESSRINAIYSLGMRGVHDSKMEGVKDSKEAVPLLESIIKDQRELLTKYVNKEVSAIPQVFTAYKEVLEIYDNGLKLPDDVTLVWPDDNYGYIQRLNNKQEMNRPGGSGVYYHASYWGRPHDYLWISSTNPALIQEEMMKAFENGSNRLWVLNVGDIKPLEYNIEMFMDLAYNALPFKDNGYAKKHLLQWAAYLFGNNKAKSVQSILWEYYQLAFERKPEFMGWSQTEPTTNTNYTTFNHFFYGDEAQKRIDRYQIIEDKVKVLRSEMLPKDAAAFYQLVYYPVVGASLMNKKFLYRDKSYFYAKQNRLSAFDYAKLSTAAYDSIIMETDYFNNQLSGGKWKNMLSFKPRNLPVFQAPDLPQINMNGSASWTIAPEGMVTSDSSLLQGNDILILPTFDNLNRQQYFIDLFLTESKLVNWTATASAPWIRLSAKSGKLNADFEKKQYRIIVTVDWNKVPKQAAFAGHVKFEGDGKQLSVALSGSNLILNNFKGFIENNGYVSIHASHYSRQVKRAHGDWQPLPGVGYTGESLQSKAVPFKNMELMNDTNWLKKNSSYAEYDFYTFSPDNATVTVFSLPTHPLNNDYSMRYALSVDDSPLQLLDFRTVGRSEEWKQHVLSNRAERKVPLSFLNKGKHSLRIYAIDPGVILDAILIDLGGLKSAYGDIDETKPDAMAMTGN